MRDWCLVNVCLDLKGKCWVSASTVWKNGCRTHVSKLASDASEKFGERIKFTPLMCLANADYCGAGYGVLTDAEREAVKLFAKYEGLLLDPVYTGRAAAGMIDLIRKGFFKKDETVLFWHTGGQPALFADKYANKISKTSRRFQPFGTFYFTRRFLSQ